MRPPVRRGASCGVLALVLVLGAGHAARAEEEARDFVEFTQDFTAACVARQGVQILVKSS
ncbi:MAG: hypothetical protein JNM26_00180, partial [Ideonella sp.]|nr:hypothetical protein [Ideonella sp.]